MAHFLCKLVPPRASFAMDMTPDEAEAMGRHAAWWTEQTRRGTALLFGPVLDPAGIWGLAVIDVPDESAARALVAEDPVITAGLGLRFEIYAMPRTTVASPVA